MRPEPGARSPRRPGLLAPVSRLWQAGPALIARFWPPDRAPEAVPRGETVSPPRRPGLRERLWPARLALQITAAELRWLVLRQGRIAAWESAPLPADAISQGQIRDPEALGRALQVVREKSPSSRVAVALPARYGQTAILTVAKATGSPRHPLFASVLAAELGVPTSRYHLAWQVIGEQYTGWDVLVVAVRHSQVQSLVEGFQAAGLQIERLELAPLAALRALPPREALLVLAEPDSLSVVVSLMGLPVVVHTLTPAPGPEGVPEAAVAALEEALRQYAARSPQTPLDPLPPLYLAGSQAGNLRLADRLGRALGMAPELLPAPPGAPAGLPTASFLVNLGLVSP